MRQTPRDRPELALFRQAYTLLSNAQIPLGRPLVGKSYLQLKLKWPINRGFKLLRRLEYALVSEETP
jgi:hypothetical protein